MKIYNITFQSRDTLPGRLEAVAKDLGITPEQLIRRFISAGIAELEGDTGPCISGETLMDFLVKNGVWKEEDGR